MSPQWLNDAITHQCRCFFHIASEVFTQCIPTDLLPQMSAIATLHMRQSRVRDFGIAACCPSQASFLVVQATKLMARITRRGVGGSADTDKNKIWQNRKRRNLMGPACEPVLWLR